MNKKAFEKILKISEEFFGTQSDPNQMPINQDSADKLLSIHKDAVVYKFDEKGDPIAWAVAVPTSLDTMNSFLNKKITEKELLNIAVKEKSFDALYLCAVFVLPEYRKKGYGKELILDIINKIPNAKNATLYTWIYSREGEKLKESLQKDFKKPVLSIVDENLI